MIACAVYGCTNNTVTTTDISIQYYYFPKHPVIAQQWIQACWRADQIDTTTARICSIHFDNNSYTSEYKMLDYLGCYSKVLKYDAVPTLYLPSSGPVIIKENIEESVNPNTLETTDTNQHIVVYTIPIAQEQPGTFEADTKVQNFTVEMAHSSEPPVIIDGTEDAEKCSHINNFKQLEQLKRENASLKKEIQTLQPVVEKLREELYKKQEACNKSNTQLNKLIAKSNWLQTSAMSIQEQKNILSKVFSESQIKILSGKKKIYWSNDDMAMGYTIRHMSSKRCYFYLTKNLNIPLPAISSIKRWATTKKGEPKDQPVKEDPFEVSD